MRTLFAAACLLTLSAGLAAAHDGPEREGGKEGKTGDGKFAACKADAERLCKDVEPGGGRIMACLKAHESELSDGCRIKKGGKEGEKREKRIGEGACEADRAKLCADVKPGEGRIVACMKSHKEDLSSACREMMDKKGDGPGRKKEEEKVPPKKEKDSE